MPLWGATDSDESKPKNLTTAQKKQVFANASGWVLEAGSALSGNDNTRCRSRSSGCNRRIGSDKSWCCRHHCKIRVGHNYC